MSKFFLITKINLLSFLNVRRAGNAKYKKEKKKNLFKIIIFLIIVLYLSFYVYKIVDLLMPGFISMNMPIALLGVMFTITSIFIFFYNLFKVKSILFDFKDYDLLNSLPLKRNSIILSKITSVYLLNLLYALIIMIPSFVCFTKYLHVNFDVLYFVLLLVIPIIPLLLSFIIGIIITWLTSFFKNKNIGSYIINIGIIIIVLLLSINFDNMDSLTLATKGMDLFDKVGSIYPLSHIYVRLLSDFHFLDLLVFILIPIILTYLFIFLINNYYSLIRTKLLKTNIKKDYIVRMYHKKSALLSLYKKEIKKFFSNPLYVINTLFGCVLLIVITIGIALFNDNTLGRYLNIPDFSTFLKQNIIFVITFACALSCTTHPSISLEGKNFWIIKMIPVSTDKIFLSKIMVNLTFLLPTIFISGTFFGIYMHFSLMEFILIYLMPISYAIFIAIIGLIFNLLFPNFHFDNEIRVIKQSMSSFLTIIVGLSSCILPMVLGNINIEFMLLITILMFIINILLAFILHQYGKVRMRRL